MGRVVVLLSGVVMLVLSIAGFVAAEETVDVTPAPQADSENVVLQANSEQPAVAQDGSEQPELAGEFFGFTVPLQNYYFIRGVIAVFGNKWGPHPQTQEETEKVVWDQLLMSFEAFRRGVEVNQQEVDEEINKILAAEKVEFDWKNDRNAYEQWVKDKTNEAAEAFENQLRHLIQIHKLRQRIMDSVEPPVSEQEAYQEFLNENNNLSVELVQFDEKKDADNFYRQARRDKKFWDAEKEKNPKDFKRPGAVALEFLLDMWGFSRDACYKMLKMEAGAIHPPAPIYKGYGVFKILAKGLGDKSRYPKVKDGYYEQIKDRKRFEALGKWFEGLKTQANIKIYHQPVAEVKNNESDSSAQ